MSQPPSFNDYLEDKKPRLNSEFWMLISLIALIIICLVLFLSSQDIQLHAGVSTENKNQIVSFILAFIVGFIGNLLASLVWERRLRNKINNDTNKQIDNIRALSNPMLINTILNDINYYQGRRLENYKVIAHLNCLTSSLEGVITKDFLICDVKFSYKKNIYNDNLIFRFIRNRSSSDDQLLRQQEIESNNSFFKNEFYYTFNERSFGNLPESERTYKLVNLKVNHHDLPFRRSTQHVADNVIEYCAELPRDIKKGDFIEIEYDIRFIIESESHLFFVIELPSKGASCQLTYAGANGLIDISAYDFLTSKKGAVFEHKKELGMFDFFTDEWILPKSNFLFSWYQNEI